MSTSAEFTELEQKIEKAVALAIEKAAHDAFAEHRCNFDEIERKALHQMADHLNLEQLTALSLLAKALNSAGAKVGQAIIWGLFAGALLVIGWLAARGIIPNFEP